jgi:integrase/recombinase XerD
VLPSDELLDRYIEACAARGLAPGTLEQRRCYVRHFLRWVGGRDLGTLTAEDVHAYSNKLAAFRSTLTKRPLASHTHAQRLWLVIDLFEWLVERRLIFANPASGLCPKMPPRPLPKSIPTEREMNRILAVPNTRTSIGRRDRAILELMYSTGLRLGEVVALDVTDLDLTAGTVQVRRSKNGQGRVVPLGEAAVAALLDYLQHSRPGFVQNAGCAALFLAGDQNHYAGNRLTTHGIRYTLRRIARKAGIDRPVNPHQFRHACATHMLRAGADIRHIQQLLGHARIDTTEIYTRVEVSDLADVLARSHPRCRKQRSE